jgi:hypothetical protein
MNFNMNYGNLKQSFFNSYDSLKTGITEKLYENNKLLVDGINGFTFSILNNRSVKLGGEITDYITENNAKVQDHISLNPIIAELSGFVGEVLEEAPKDIKYQKVAQSKLNEFGGFLPELSVKAQEYFNKAKDLKAKAESIIDRIDNAANFLRNLENIKPELTKIERAYIVLSEAWRNRMLMTVNTEFSVFTNMAIQSFEFSKNSDEKYKSDLRITLKQITIAKKIEKKADGRTNGQKATTINQGEVAKNQSTAHSGKTEFLKRFNIK